jgi:biopolymer transport protein ExbB
MLTIITSAGWTIWPLLLISIIGLAILLERIWFLRKNKVSPDVDLERALTIMKDFQIGKHAVTPEIERLELSSPLGQILSKGLLSFMSRANQNQCLDIMREYAAPELVRLNQYLNVLATIATIAPLMGLFGTVLGMIEIFGSQGANGSPQLLAQGISMALYNTAFGLLIAIPALAGWRLLRSLADKRAYELNDATRVLLKKMFPQ